MALKLAEKQPDLNKQCDAQGNIHVKHYVFVISTFLK